MMGGADGRRAPVRSDAAQVSGNSGSAFTVPGLGMAMFTRGGNVRNILLAAVIAIAGGCGYQLRGAVSLPQDPGAMHITGPRNVADALVLLLEAAGIRVEPTRESATTLLRLEDERFSQRVLSVNPNTGKESEFELAYRVTFQVTGPEGEALVPRQTVSLLRDYVFDADAVLGKSREENVLHAEMRRDAAGRIARRIAASLGQ